jgi:hypothetical protein
LNRHFVSIHLMLTVLSLSISVGITKYASCQDLLPQDDWDGRIVGSSDYFLPYVGYKPIVHVLNQDAWFFTEYSLLRVDLKSGKTKAEFQVPFDSISGKMAGEIVCATYDQFSQSIVALIIARDEWQILSFDETTLERRETLYSAMGVFDFDIEDSIRSIHSRIFVVENSRDIWVLCRGTAIRLAKKENGEFYEAETIKGIIDLAPTEVNRIASISFKGEMSVRDSSRPESAVSKTLEPWSDHMSATIQFCKKLNRLIVHSWGDFRWQAFDCKTLDLAWTLTSDSNSPRLRNIDATLWKENYVYISYGLGGSYLLSMIDLENGTRQDEQFTSWTKSNQSNEFPKDPAVIFHDHRVMIFDINSKRIWNQSGIRPRSFIRNLNWLDSHSLVASGFDTQVYDLKVKEAEDPTLLLIGHTAAVSPSMGLIATKTPDYLDVYSRQGERIIRVNGKSHTLYMPIAFGSSGKELNYVARDGVFITWDMSTRKLSHAFFLYKKNQEQTNAQLEKTIDENLRSSILDSSARDETVKAAMQDVVRGLQKNGSDQFVGIDSPASSSFADNLKFDRSGRFLIGSYPESPFHSPKEPFLGLRLVLDHPRQLNEIHIPETSSRIANWTCDSTGESIAFVDKDFHGEDKWPARTGVVSIYRNGATSTAEIPHVFDIYGPIFVRHDRFVIAWGNLQKVPHQYHNLSPFISITDVGDTRAHVVHEIPTGVFAVAVSPDEKWLAFASRNTTIHIRSLESLLPR